LTEFSQVILLYSILSNLGDFQYLYIDLVIVLPLAIFSNSLQLSLSHLVSGLDRVHAVSVP